MKGLNFFNKLVYFFNILCALLLLLACIAPYVTWELFSFLSFLSLIVPYLVMVNVLFFIYWSFLRKKQFLISFSILLLGYLTQGTFIKLVGSNKDIKSNEITVLSFNTLEFNGFKWTKNPVSREKIVGFINEQDADIVLLQEFGVQKSKEFKLYPYKFVNYNFSNEKKVVQAIFSKFPIINKGSLDFPKSSNNAIYADLLIKEDTIRVYNLHLESLRVRAGSFKREQPDKLFNRLKKSFVKQQEQANLVAKHSAGTTYDKIIGGDFNNTQFSSVYNTIKGNMTDTFLELGLGLGSTYNFKFLPFRIDFILVDEVFEVKAHKNFEVRLSDHKPVMASFSFKE